MVGPSRLERLTSSMSTMRSNQLSYGPMVGMGGLEPPASSLSGTRSNQLSYMPKNLHQV